MRVFLDIDCVLANFIEGVAKVMGIPHAVLLNHWTPGEYGIGHAMAAAYAHHETPLTITAKTAERMFWFGVEGKPQFWADLEPFPWTAEMLRLAEDVDPDFRLLTSPSDCGHCLLGKHQWLTRMGVNPGRMIPTKYKHELAAPHRLLIDDHSDNTVQWAAHGGETIVFPALHNYNHPHAGDPLGFTKLHLNRLLHGGAT